MNRADVRMLLLDLLNRNTWSAHKHQTEITVVLILFFLPDASWFHHLVRMLQELRDLVIRIGGDRGTCSAT